MGYRIISSNGILIHSAKGTSWEKKDHKYIRKENGKYYYEDNKSFDKEIEDIEKKYDLEDENISLNEFRKKYPDSKTISDRESEIRYLKSAIKAYNSAKTESDKEYAEAMIESSLSGIYEADTKLKKK